MAFAPPFPTAAGPPRHRNQWLIGVAALCTWHSEGLGGGWGVEGRGAGRRRRCEEKGGEGPPPPPPLLTPRPLVRIRFAPGLGPGGRCWGGWDPAHAMPKPRQSSGECPGGGERGRVGRCAGLPSGGAGEGSKKEGGGGASETAACAGFRCSLSRGRRGPRPAGSGRSALALGTPPPFTRALRATLSLAWALAEWEQGRPCAPTPVSKRTQTTRRFLRAAWATIE